MRIQTLGAWPAVERFDLGIIGRFPNTECRGVVTSTFAIRPRLSIDIAPSHLTICMVSAFAAARSNEVCLTPCCTVPSTLFRLGVRWALLVSGHEFATACIQ